MARFYKPTKNTKINTKHQQVTVTKLDHHGAGMAFVNKKPVFIEGVLPGEEVVIQFTEQKSKYAKAKLIKMKTASEQRVEAPCRYYNECGGCNMQHLAHEAQVANKQQALTQLMGKFAGESIGLTDSIISRAEGYRRRARISMQRDKKTNQLMFGFRQKMSKQIVTVTDCMVLAPELNVLLPKLEQLLSGFKPIDKLGHLELVLADSGVVLVLRHLAELKAQEHQSLVEFAEQHELTLYLMPEAGQLDRICGDEPYYQEVGLPLSFAPNNFVQVNQAVNQSMVEQALKWLDAKSDERVLDLFCGIGNFSLPLAKQSKEVVGVEGIDEMVQRATHNAQLNQIENAHFYQADLEQDMTQAVWAQRQFDKVLLDPARGGAAGIVEQISSLGAKAVVYVSCNPATLARDSQSLLQQGYTLKKLAMLDMFPHTSHLESMALFEK